MLPALFRRRQFSLATLFIVVMLASVVAAGVGIRRQALLAEDQSLTKIAAKGAWVLLYDEGAYIEFYSQPPAGPLIVDCGTGLVRTYKPSASSADFTDDDLPLFNDVRRILTVNFRNTSVSSAALQQFRSKHPQCRVEP